MNILLVDDHKIIRQVLSSFICDNLDADITEANNGVEGLIQLKKKDFDLVISDINMPKMDGIEFTTEAINYNPDLKVIALSMLDDQVSIKKMLRAGAIGYVLKEGNSDDLLDAIKKVVDGEKYYSATVKDTLIADMIKGKKDHKKASLTKREKEILYLIFNEKSNAEIADELFISLRTVETHKHNILEKTGTKTWQDL